MGFGTGHFPLDALVFLFLGWGGGCPQGVEMEGGGCPQGVEMEGGGCPQGVEMEGGGGAVRME